MGLLSRWYQAVSLLDELLHNEGVIQLGLPSLNETVFFGPYINILRVLREEQGAEELAVLLVVPELLELLQFGDSVVLSLGHGEVGESDVAKRCVFANLGKSGVVELRKF